MDLPGTGHQFRDRSKRFALALFGLVLLLLLGGLALRPAWLARKRVLAERFVQKAREAQRQRDWNAAAASLRVAHELAGTHPPVLRALAEYYTRFSNQNGVVYWEMLEQSGQMTQEDRLGFTRLALALQRTDIARRVLMPLHQAAPNDPGVLELVSQIFELDGDLSQALVSAQDALNRGAPAASAGLRLARLELAKGGNDNLARAKSRLLALVASDPKARGEAAMLLLSWGLTSAVDDNLIASLLGKGPEISFEERLVLLILGVKKKPEAAAELLAGFVATNQLADVSPKLVFAAEQLARVRQDRAVLELIPEPLALQNADLCRLRLRALAATEDIAAVERLLTHTNQPLSSMQMAIFQAGVAQKAGRTNEVGKLWQSALAECRHDPTALELLAQHAEAVGAVAVAGQAWETMLQDPILAPRATKELMRIGTALRDPRTLYVALRRLAQLRPEDTGVRLTLSYCRLLLDVDREAALAALEQGADRYAAKDFYQIVRALGALRQGLMEQAVEAIEDPILKWENSPIAWRVVRTAVYGRAGQYSRAREVAATLNPDELSAAELALVANWLPTRRPGSAGR